MAVPSPTFTMRGVLTLHGEMHVCLELLCAHAMTLPPEDFTRDVPGFGRGCVRDQLVHIVAVESRWVSAIQNAPLRDFDPAVYPTVQHVSNERSLVAAATMAYLNELGDEAIDRVLVERPAEWVGPLRSPGFIVHHIITHAFHHKGQIASMFRLLGSPLGDTDLQRE